MYKNNCIILERFNGTEIYEYTNEGEYGFYFDSGQFIHYINIYAEKTLQELDDSVCGQCGGVHIDIEVSTKNSNFSKVKKGLKYSGSPIYKDDEEIIPWLVCCSHIELDHFDVEILDMEDKSITLQMYAELWGPSDFDESKSKTKLYYKGTIPYVPS